MAITSFLITLGLVIIPTVAAIITLMITRDGFLAILTFIFAIGGEALFGTFWLWVYMGMGGK